MATRSHADSARNAKYGAILLVIHEFTARSTDELSLAKGDRIELIERDDDFGDGWYLGRHLSNGKTGLFPEVYTIQAPKGTLTHATAPRPSPNQPAATMRSASTPTHLISQLSQSVVGGAKKSPTVEKTYSMGSVTVPGQRESIDRYSQIQPQGSITKTPQSTTPTSANASAQDRTSAVMNETLSVIDEHITDMRKPGLAGSRPYAQKMRTDSASSYGAHQSETRLSYIQGSETEEEESSRLTEAEVKSWSPERVAEYLEDVGVEKQHCQTFIEQEFTGEVILALDQPSLFLKELELGMIGRRLKTWHKIKALQDEVIGPRPQHTRQLSETSQTTSRRTSIASSAILPKSSSILDKSGFDHNDVVPQPQSNQTQPSSPHSFQANSLRQNPRPSAASVRSLGHSRRQSSIDQTLNPPTSSASAANSPYLTQSGHQKQPSLDRSWNMNSAKNRSTPDVTRPGSTHVPTPSSERTTFDKRASQLTLNTMTSTVDIDRGYVSSGEGENRNKKRVLRRREGMEHSRASSYDTTSKRRSILSFRRNSRASSPNRTSTINTPELDKLPENRKRTATRVVSEPTADGSAPTVTRLEYSTIDENTSTNKTLPRVPSQQSPSTLNFNPSPKTQSQPPPSKGLSGLRVISDAITNKEKAMHTIYAEPASTTTRTTTSTDSPKSPTSSTTPSQKSKSIELPEDTNSSKHSSATTPAGTRRKSKSKPKKKTSAYTQGLEKKSPAEQMVGCDYSGWMKKKSSNLMTTWKPRLFVLRGRRLSYYYSENDTEEKGLIDISGHRVLPADNERLTGLHATLTGAMNSPTSPQKSANPSLNASPAVSTDPFINGNGATSAPVSNSASKTSTPSLAQKADAHTGTFIFKLVPPRPFLSRSVNFTKPSVHYFAVPSIAEGRAWMAAMLKVTIDRDESTEVVTTYQQKTISLEKARERGERPAALRDWVEQAEVQAEAGAEEEAANAPAAEKGELPPSPSAADGASKENELQSPKQEQITPITDLSPTANLINANSPTTKSPTKGRHGKTTSSSSSTSKTGKGKRGGSGEGLGILGLGIGGS